MSGGSPPTNTFLENRSILSPWEPGEPRGPHPSTDRLESSVSSSNSPNPKDDFTAQNKQKHLSTGFKGCDILLLWSCTCITLWNVVTKIAWRTNASKLIIIVILYKKVLKILKSFLSVRMYKGCIRLLVLLPTHLWVQKS